MNIKQKKILIPAAVVITILIAAGVYAVYHYWQPRLPDPKTQTNEEIIQQFQSESFRQMPAEQRRQYAQTAITQIITEHAETYMALPEEERTAYLDQRIDEMQQHMQDMRQRFQQQRQENHDQQAQRPEPQEGQDRPRRGGPGRNFTPDRFRERAENVDPRTRALMSQFMLAMRARMQQRGMSSPFGSPPPSQRQ